MWNFDALVEEQKRGATGQRLEMLNRDMTGTRKLIETSLLPALPSMDGIVLEHELISLSGVRIYIDVFYPPLFAAFECDGFAAHAENITRDRFSFERMRMRTIAAQGYRYLPFSYDELEKKPELCRRTVFELLGRYGSPIGSKLGSLTIQEREVLRFAMMRVGGAFGLREASEWLQWEAKAVSRLLRRMLADGLLEAVGSGTMRHHAYSISEKGKSLFC